MKDIYYFVLLLLGLNFSNQEGDLSKMSDDRKLVKVEFEVHGKVQGVFFRKNTVMEGRRLGLRGWCMNTPQGTVAGVLEGEPDKVQEMKHWLANIGSRSSRIDKADFKNEKDIPKYSFSDFTVRN